VILLAEIEQARDAAHIVEKLRAASAVPYLIGGCWIVAFASRLRARLVEAVANAVIP
jgi:hypothetical protein